MLRATKDKAKTQLFLGMLERGELSLGVIDTTEGYIAGRFFHGRLADDADRNVTLNAFRKGSAAAKAYSQRLKHEGNQKSAEFYATEAQNLAQQMD